MDNSKDNREIEARFLEIDVDNFKKKLKAIGAVDLGLDHLDEVVFYDREYKWRGQGQFVRLRKSNEGVRLTYKHHQQETVDGTLEIELEVDDFVKAQALLQSLGLVAFRQQEKTRHRFRLGDVAVDIDTWPKIPPYAELEGPTEQALREVAEKMGLDWSKAHFGGAYLVIENIYGIPVRQMKYYMFDRME